MNMLQGKQIEVKAQKPKPEIHENFEGFKENLKFIGITDLKQENVNSVGSVLELIKMYAGEVEDHGTDYKISISGDTVYIGKSVVNTLDSELTKLRSNK